MTLDRSATPTTVRHTTGSVAILRAERAPRVRETLLLIMALNCVTVIVKLVVGLRTHSLSVLGASLESGLDVLNNVIGMALVRVAARGPDEDFI